MDTNDKFDYDLTHFIQIHRFHHHPVIYCVVFVVVVVDSTMTKKRKQPNGIILRESSLSEKPRHIGLIVPMRLSATNGTHINLVRATHAKRISLRFDVLTHLIPYNIYRTFNIFPSKQFLIDICRFFSVFFFFFFLTEQYD